MKNDSIDLKKLTLDIISRNRTFDKISMENDINNLSRCIQNQGIAPQTDLRVFIENLYDFLVCIISLISNKLTFTIVSSLPSAQERSLVATKNTTLRYIIITEDTIQQWTQDFDPKNVMPSKSQNLKIPIDSVFYFLTSGSTGTPKKVEKSLRCLLNEADVLASTFPLVKQKKEDVSISTSVTHNHLYGFMFQYLFPLKMGLTVNCEVVTIPETLGAHLEKRKVIFISSPAFLKRTLEFKNNRNLVAVFSSGGVLTSKLARSVVEANTCPVLEIYGSTETGGIAYRDHYRGKKQVPLFGDMKSTTDMDVSPTWNFLDCVAGDIDENACLIVKSPFIHEGVFTTSDICEFKADGTFTLIGRNDRIVKIEDKRLSLEEMERAIIEHPSIESCAVVKLTNSYREITVCCYSLKKGTNSRDQFAEEIEYLLTERLSVQFSNSLLPKKYRLVDNIPQNAQGKILYGKIIELFR